MQLFEGWTADDTLKALALIGAAIAFVVGLLQYRKAQRWKRAEWVAKEMKEFFAAPQVEAAFKMIDWGMRSVQLFPRKEGEERFDVVSSAEIMAALQPHEGRDRFSAKEAAIRDSFDQLFDGLERFESYICTGLITASDVEPYLDYWGIHLRPDSPQEKLRRIREYMTHYGWESAEALLDRFQPERRANGDGTNSHNEAKGSG